MPHIEVADVSLTYDTPPGQVPGVDGVSFDIEAVRIPLHRRALGLRQVDAAQHHRGLSQPHRRAKSASAARPSPATASTAAWCSRTSPSCFRGAPRSATSTFGLEMKGIGKAEREEIALRAAAAGEAREIRASPIRTICPAECSSGSPSRGARLQSARCC